MNTNKMTVWVSEPSVVCARVKAFLDERGYAYEAIQVDSDATRRRMLEETGHMTCPLVVVGEEIVGGLEATVEADRSGRLRALTGTLSADDERELRALNDQYIHADQHSNVAAYETFLGEDFVAQLPDLEVRDRQQFLDMIARPRPFTGLTLDHVTSHALGTDVALLHGRVHYVTTHDGQRREALYTDTYHRRDGRWVCVAGEVVARGE